MTPAAGLLEFGPYRLDAARRLLWRKGELVPLTPKALEVLVVLVQQAGQVVAKQELMERVWPDTFVEEANLSVNVSALRKALGEQEDGRPYIQTVSRKGYRFLAEARQTKPALRSLAVLPFASLEGGGGDETLGLGMADALITRLGRVGQILVRPTSAVVKHAAPGRDPREVGRELQVDAVLDGRLQRAGSRIRATVQLLSVDEGTTLWADTFDEELRQIFAVQDAISERLARALTLRLGPAERERLTRHHTESVEAYQAYLRGRYFWNKLTGSWLEKAREAFEDAIRADPSFALAHSGLADTYAMLAVFGLLPPRQTWPRAQVAAERALELDEALPEAHISLAYVRLFRDWAWSEAEPELTRALELNPASAAVRQWHALYLAMTGRFEQALGEIQRAQELDPLSLTISTNVGFHFYLTHQYEDEIEQHKKTLDLEPDYAVGYWALGLAYDQKGMHEEAIAANRRSVELTGGNAQMKSNLARSYALAGRTEEARQLLGELEGLYVSAHVSAYRLATVHAALGDPHATLAWLEKALGDRDHWMVWLKVDPMLEPVRSDPRFAGLLVAVGFPPDAPSAA